MKPKSHSERQHRFLDSFIPEPNSGCWLFDKGELMPNGYGRFFISDTVVPSREIAHRFSYKLFIGDIPVGKCVLHKCDTRLCVNPNHLFLGDKADNAHDAMSKDRHTRGSRQGQAKLNEEDVERIRSEYKTGQCSQRELAKRYGVAQYQIWAVVNHRAWKHVA